VPGLQEHGLGFKSLPDAIELRNRLIRTLEAAETLEDPDERRAWLTYIFVGAGYAGLEGLAELQDFAADAIEHYPRGRTQGMRWILVEATGRVMPEISPQLADFAVRELRGRGIEIKTNTTLDALTDSTATLSDGEVVPARTCVWTAGVRPHPVVEQLGLPLNDTGRIVVDDTLRVQGRANVWAIGDSAAVPDPDAGGRRPTPPTAQHAIRQGKTVARNVAAELGIGTPKRFTYRNKGAFVNLGRYKAVARVGNRNFRGFPAWWMARTYHVSQIPGAARKLRAVVDWTVGLPFRRDVAEVGSIGHPRPLRDEVYARGGTHRPLD
jgi:NADH dehydrogenase